MGIGFSHGDARWSYSGFKYYRTALAAHEDLKPFLEQPDDYGGRLSPEQCAVVAPILRVCTAAAFPEPGNYDYDHGMILAEGMEAAAARGEVFEFL